MTDWIVAGLEQRMRRLVCLVFVAGAVAVVAVFAAWRGVAWLIAHVRFQ